MREWLIALIMPPPEGADERQLYMWRVTISIATLCLAAVLFTHLAWSVGYPPFNGSGFVQTRDFHAVASEVRAARLNSLRVDINRNVKESCSASGAYKQQLGETLTALLIEWERLNNTKFPVLRCDQIT
jgi:hypothetical protein